MLINLEKESSIIKHGFFCKLDENINNIVITNAYQSNYSKGWIDYAPFESEDGKKWTRTKPGSYNGKEFSFNVCKNSQYISWFPPYNINN